jgi:sulfite exporter TauE/SafE
MAEGDFPAPDLMDTAGRVRRLVIALLVGAACGGIGYAIAHALVQPEAQPEAAHVASRQMSAGSFVIWVGLVAGIAGLILSLALQNVLAKRKWRADQMPRAQVR